MHIPPKVFVSHASEDKVRFVLSFAEKLRQKGIDAWLDKWEMLPGDSLVDKIFEEGIKESKTVIVVLSKFSVEKPWVRKELNAAVMKHINTGCKLIPIVLDECNIPEVLKATVWERIDNLADYQSEFDRIVAAINGTTDKPPLGPAPAYTKPFLTSIGGLSKMDSLVLKIACEQALETGSDFIDTTETYIASELEIPVAVLQDSIEVLDQNGYFSVFMTIGGGLNHFRLTTNGFDLYANACIANYQEILKETVSAIVNMELTGNEFIANFLKHPPFLIDHILDVLESRRHIKMTKYSSGGCHIYNVSPTLKRLLNG